MNYVLCMRCVSAKINVPSVRNLEKNSRVIYLKMLRIVRRFTPAIAFPFFTEKSHFDQNRIGQIEERPRTGYDRVKLMFSSSDSYAVSPELQSVIQMSLTGAFVGACIGGFIKSRQAYLYFIETNQATIFKSTMEAKKKLQDYMTVAFAKGAVHLGWRLAFFSGTFGLISTVISTYRDKTSVLEYVVAGFMTGVLYKANLGLAAAMVGGGLGAALSLVGGTIICGILILSGITMDDIRKALYTVKEFRERNYDEALEKSAEIKYDDVTRHHDMLVMQKGEKKVKEI